MDDNAKDLLRGIKNATEKTAEAVATPPVGGATSEKQDSQLSKEQEILAELQLKADANEAQMAEFIIALRNVLNVIANPVHGDKSNNALRILVVSGTVTTVTTVTNLTNFGTQAADGLFRINTNLAWSQIVRPRIT